MASRILRQKNASVHHEVAMSFIFGHSVGRVLPGAFHSNYMRFVPFGRYS